MRCYRKFYILTNSNLRLMVLTIKAILSAAATTFIKSTKTYVDVERNFYWRS